MLLQSVPCFYVSAAANDNPILRVPAHYSKSAEENLTLTNISVSDVDLPPQHHLTLTLSTVQLTTFHILPGVPINILTHVCASCVSSLTLCFVLHSHLQWHTYGMGWHTSSL